MAYRTTPTGTRRQPLPPLGKNAAVSSGSSRRVGTGTQSGVKTTSKKKNTTSKKKSSGSLASTTASSYRVDYIILLTVILLVSFGVVMVFSSSYYAASMSADMKNDMFYFLKKEVIFSSVGFVAMFFTMNFDYHKYKDAGVMRIAVFSAYIAVAILLGLVLIMGDTLNGAKRWIFGFQPSEIAKPVLILVMAILLDEEIFDINKFKGFCAAALVLGVYVALVLAEPNLSTSIILCLIWAGMVYIVTKVYRYLYSIAGLGVLGMYFMLFVAKGFRSDRVAAWLNPFADVKDTGYQVVQSLYSIASGGMFGLGLGCSRQKLGYMPEAQNDIIFAIICEELGFFGATILIIIFMLLIWRGVRTALKAKDRFGMLIATGVTVMIAVQVIINIAVVTNTIPNTGIPLPFISYGGTSLIFMMASVGMLMNVSKYTN